MTWACIALNSMDFVSSIGRSSCNFISSYFLQTNNLMQLVFVVFWLISHAKPTWLLNYWGWRIVVRLFWEMLWFPSHGHCIMFGGSLKVETPCTYNRRCCTVSKLWLTWIGQTKKFDAENLGLEVLLAQLVPPFLLVCLQPNAKPNCASQGNPVCQAKRAIELPAIWHFFAGVVCIFEEA